MTEQEWLHAIAGKEALDTIEWQKTELERQATVIQQLKTENDQLRGGPSDINRFIEHGLRKEIERLQAKLDGVEK